jgi:hypothetical protein
MKVFNLNNNNVNSGTVKELKSQNGEIIRIALDKDAFFFAQNVLKMFPEDILAMFEEFHGSEKVNQLCEDPGRNNFLLTFTNLKCVAEYSKDGDTHYINITKVTKRYIYTNNLVPVNFRKVA